MDEAEVRALVREGLDAMRRDDPRPAIARFTRVVEAGAADASLWLALSAAHRRQGELVNALTAADAALRLEPSNLRALIFKGDLLDQRGDLKSASAYYLAALKAAPDRATLPPDLIADLDRAQSKCNQLTDTLEDSVRNRLRNGDASAVPTSARFEESIDILFHRKVAQFQAPRYYFFPGLAHLSFFDRALFNWIGDLERATDAIREELIAVLQTPDDFRPYVESTEHQPKQTPQSMTNNLDWSAFFLWRNGEIVAENARRCPQTMKALASVPLTRVANRSPSVLFSLLRPGAHIPAHNGLVNTRLIAHLPLIVPPGCEFRVGNERRVWEEGKIWLFDDSIEHEAWNRSDQTRVILLFEVWRPELTHAERDGVSSLFDAIDAQSMRKPDWEI